MRPLRSADDLPQRLVFANEAADAQYERLVAQVLSLEQEMVSPLR
jgi:hypothetical protein